MEKKSIKELIDEAKRVKFSDPIKRKSWDEYRVKFVVDENYNINWVVKYTTWINIDKTIKNSHLKDMFVISCGMGTSDEAFKKRYLR